MKARPTLLGATIIVAAVLSGCSPTASPEPVDPAATTDPAASSTPNAASPTAPATPTSSADAFAERDQYMAEQQLPADGSELVAVTDAQKKFIAEQRSYVESQGATWSARHESIYLALTVDACETSILNGHEIDATRFSLHVQSSPLYRALLADLEGEQLVAGERNLTSVMVFGTGFLCPEDAPQWEAAFEELYG